MKEGSKASCIADVKAGLPVGYSTGDPATLYEEFVHMVDMSSDAWDDMRLSDIRAR